MLKFSDKHRSHFCSKIVDVLIYCHLHVLHYRTLLGVDVIINMFLT